MIKQYPFIYRELKYAISDEFKWVNKNTKLFPNAELVDSHLNANEEYEFKLIQIYKFKKETVPSLDESIYVLIEDTGDTIVGVNYECDKDYLVDIVDRAYVSTNYNEMKKYFEDKKKNFNYLQKF